eukprot:757253-Hanusia_phi.AAC.3
MAFDGRSEVLVDEPEGVGGVQPQSKHILPRQLGSNAVRMVDKVLELHAAMQVVVVLRFYRPPVVLP